MVVALSSSEIAHVYRPTHSEFISRELVQLVPLQVCDSSPTWMLVNVFSLESCNHATLARAPTRTTQKIWLKKIESLLSLLAHVP